MLHLIGQADRAVIPQWIPNTAINRYVFELLGIEGKVAERDAEQVVERPILDAMSGRMSHHSSGAETGASDGGHGGDSGH